MNNNNKNTVFTTNTIFWGVTLIVIGIGVILCAAGIIPGSAYRIVMTAIFAAVAIRCAISFIFIPFCMALGHIVYLYRDVLQVPENVHGWMLIAAATLIGVGLEIIFGRLVRTIKKQRKAANEPYITETVKSACKSPNSTGNYSEDMTGSNINIENGFGEQTRYIRSKEFSNGNIENGFGGLTIYFEDVTLLDNHANLNIENGFGHVNVYLPSCWAINYTEDNGMGNITFHGNPSTDPDAPKLNVHIQNGMGKVDVYLT